MADFIQEAEQLRAELNQANYEYYVLDNPSMSDYDYDHKLRHLEELETAHPELKTPDSPTQRVGGKVAEGFAEVVHEVPLESLQDVFSTDELTDFDQRVRETVPAGIEYDVEPKVDGLSVALEYENGLFVRGATVEMAVWVRMLRRICVLSGPSPCGSRRPCPGLSFGVRSICPRRCSTSSTRSGS